MLLNVFKHGKKIFVLLKALEKEWEKKYKLQNKKMLHNNENVIIVHYVAQIYSLGH